jgi:DNA replication protein DnaC
VIYLDTYVLRDLLKEYNLKKQRADDECKKNKREIFLKIPEVSMLQDELATVSIKSLKNNMIQDQISREIETQNLEIKINEINSKIVKSLKRNGYNLEMFNPKYECNLCKDTGYVDNKQCSCLKQKIINIAYKQSNVLKLEDENFETFDTCFYSSKADAKYGSTKSPLENIEDIKKTSINFCKNISDKDQKNLLFIGETGIGKTFLSNCIASEVIKNGYTAIYQTASILMDTVIQYKLSYGKNDDNKQRYNQIFDADLLIIDDLGTETMNNIKFTELFNILNTRLLNNKKMIISTNLTIKKLYDTYDERVVSRLIGNFVICKFIGDDIRLKKKKIN